MEHKIPLPRGWKRRVRSSGLHVLALGHFHPLEQRTFHGAPGPVQRLAVYRSILFNSSSICASSSTERTRYSVRIDCGRDLSYGSSVHGPSPSR